MSTLEIQSSLYGNGGHLWQTGMEGLSECIRDYTFWGSLGLDFILNIHVHWFQPYKHASYSVGTVYVTIMNLRRSVRFKRENEVLIGILPGP